MTDVAPASFDALAAWEVSPDVSLRDEEFGALAYHHGTRRLVFLKSSELVSLVTCLGQHDSAEGALDALVAAPDRARYRRALDLLAAAGIIRGR